MAEHFFEPPILNSPYHYPARHWELDPDGQPTDRVIAARRDSKLIIPVPKPKKRKPPRGQLGFVLDAGDDLSSESQEYNPTPIINEVRSAVASWRALPNSDDWAVTPETARLLKHWQRPSGEFEGVSPFFCQIEAVETAIWLVEVAPKLGARGQRFRTWLEAASARSNPELLRLAMKLATGAGSRRAAGSR